MSHEVSLPPVIIALDTDTPLQAMGFAEDLASLPTELVGLKISRWHDQHEDLRRYCAETGRFTVLDTQLNDGSSKMAAAARYLIDLSGNVPAPHAITMHPFKENLRGDRDFIRKHINDFVRGFGSIVIGHSEQTRLSPTDHILHDEEYFRYREESDNPANNFGLEVMELHADTVSSAAFPAITRPRPLIIASRFGVGTSLADHKPEADVIDQVGKVFQKGIHAVYLGQSVLRSEAPLQFVEHILAQHPSAA